MRTALSRRALLRASGALALGTAGAVVLAACGEAQVVTKEVEKVVTKEVEKVVTQVVEKIVQATPVAQVQRFVFQSDHTSGPRGAAMKWALERFKAKVPNIEVKFVSAPDGVEAGRQQDAVGREVIREPDPGHAIAGEAVDDVLPGKALVGAHRNAARRAAREYQRKLEEVGRQRNAAQGDILQALIHRAKAYAPIGRPQHAAE